MTPRFARLPILAGMVLAPLAWAAPAGAQGLPGLLSDSRVIADVLDGRGGAPEPARPPASATAYRASPEAGAEKAGQPQPESNFASDSNRVWPQPAQT